ncbi:MAG: hypothetical protein M1820_005456 [Bogoriella megaspora]|nr:MAG: hypothetical protein M1820_005456 [Bogoriella megaspora]
MSERKVLSKYYPPDFDPATLEKRHRAPKSSGPKRIPVRLGAPFTMRCKSCGAYIHKGLRFNSQKETTDLKYYNIAIYRFYIRCPACSTQITFRTDPQRMDYECERGAKRNFEPWRTAKLAAETKEERLDCLEREEGEREEGERDPMKDLEINRLDGETNEAVKDALEERLAHNARVEQRAINADADDHKPPEKTMAERQREKEDAEDAEVARQAFSKKHELMDQEGLDEEAIAKADMPAEVDRWAVSRKKKKQKSKLLPQLRRRPMRE